MIDGKTAMWHTTSGIIFCSDFSHLTTGLEARALAKDGFSYNSTPIHVFSPTTLSISKSFVWSDESPPDQIDTKVSWNQFTVIERTLVRRQPRRPFENRFHAVNAEGIRRFGHSFLSPSSHRVITPRAISAIPQRIFLRRAICNFPLMKEAGGTIYSTFARTEPGGGAPSLCCHIYFRKQNSSRKGN